MDFVNGLFNVEGALCALYLGGHSEPPVRGRPEEFRA
jgi:hypothetical protein